MRLLLGLLVLALVPFFFIGGPDWNANPLIKSLWNLGHNLFFLLLTLVIRLYLGVGGWRQILTITLGIALVGLAVEYLQGLVDRQFDWRDLLRNLAGAWAVLAWQGWRGAGAWSLTIARVLVAGLWITQLVPIIDDAREQYRISNQLPLLSALEHPQALRHWSGDAVLAQRPSPGGGTALMVQFQTGRFSTAWLNNFPRDWRGFERLSFQLFNPGRKALGLSLRINDARHDSHSFAHTDRFNIRLQVAPGRNRYRIDLSDIAAAPATRGMDMDRVSRLGFFTGGLDRPRILYVEDLRLE